MMLSKKMNGKIIFKKGLVDIITNGNSVILVCNDGSLKRCGGIGDILVGILSGFLSLYRSKIDEKKF